MQHLNCRGVPYNKAASTTQQPTSRILKVPWRAFSRAPSTELIVSIEYLLAAIQRFDLEVTVNLRTVGRTVARIAVEEGGLN